MKILDKYVIFKFLSTFFFTVGILITIAIIIDISEKIDNFLETKPPFLEIIFNYYLQFIFFYTSTFSSMVIFISAIVATSKLCSNTEIIAMMSGGMSFNRFLRPYFIAATLLTIISLLVIIGWFLSPTKFG